MRTESKNPPEHLSNLQHLHVLEKIGFSPKPISSTEIEGNYKNSHVYNIVKELAGFDHPRYERIRFVDISYKEKCQQEISYLMKKYRISEDYYDVQIISSKHQEEEQMERDRAIERIYSIKTNRRNYRYSLNFKGFLLFLFSSHVNKKINSRKINSMIKNLVEKSEEFAFLEYFKIFDDDPKYKANLLVEIAVELQHQLKNITSEFLRNYAIRRCYSEIVFDERLQDSNVLYRLMPKKIKDDHIKLKRHKLRILEKMISIEKNLLRQMRDDLKLTKEDIVTMS